MSHDEDEFFITAGHCLRDARLAKGFDRATVSQRTGLPVIDLTRIEGATTVLYLDAATTLCRLYGISLDSLAGGFKPKVEDACDDEAGELARETAGLREQIVELETKLNCHRDAIGRVSQRVRRVELACELGGTNERARKDETDLANRLRSVRSVADNLRSKLEAAMVHCDDFVPWVVQAKTIVADLDAILGKS